MNSPSTSDFSYWVIANISFAPYEEASGQILPTTLGANPFLIPDMETGPFADTGIDACNSTSPEGCYFGSMPGGTSISCSSESVFPAPGSPWKGGTIDVFNTSDCSGEPVYPRTILGSNGCDVAVAAPWFPGRASKDVEAHLTMHCDATNGYARVCGTQAPAGTALIQPLLCPSSVSGAVAALPVLTRRLFCFTLVVPRLLLQFD